MMKQILCTIAVLACVNSGEAQLRLNENFDEGSSIPQGWTVWNNAPIEADPLTLWTVTDTTDTNRAVGIDGFPVAHSGSRAIGVSWLAGIDTTTGDGTQADAWLITQRITGIASGDSLVFWAAGGAPSYLDSLQIWLSVSDSTPSTQSQKLGTIVWPVGTEYGVFQRYAFDLSGASGTDTWVGFRYYQDISLDGFFVYVDDVTVGQPSTDVATNRSAVPTQLELHQNFPNPFNPVTSIEYTVGVVSSQWSVVSEVRLAVYDVLGGEVAVLVNEPKDPGTYAVRWDAGGMASGVYFCRLQSGGSVATRKLLLVR